MDSSIPQNLIQCALNFDALNNQAIPHNTPKSIVQISTIRKKCSKCGGIFNATKEFFNADKNKRDGLTPDCKKCRTAFRQQKTDRYKSRERITGETKRCSKCKETFPATREFFYLHNQRPDGLAPCCKSCYKAARALGEDWQAPEIPTNKVCPTCKKLLPSSEFSKSYRGGLQSWCKQCASKHNAIYRDVNSVKVREWHLNYHYGITIEEYERMLQMQEGVCDLCKRPETAIDNRTGKVRPLSIDHDHETGVVRALLCKNCNQALGFVKDSPELLRRMADYIEEHRSRNKSD